MILLFTLTASCARSTATPTPNATPLPTPTASVQPVPTSTGTPLPLPTVQTGCKDSALYVADVTIPDNTQVKAGESFTKTWRLKNTGNCIWNQRYALIFVGGERMGAVITTPLSETPPGATLDLSINLTAPTQEGLATGLFELRNPFGAAIQIGAVTSIWVKIRVGNVSIPVAPAAQSNSASGGNATAVPGAPCQPQPNEAVTSQILAQLNSARANDKLPPLNLNTQLSAAAQSHSQDMACNNFVSHTGSDGSSIHNRVAAAGYAPSSSEEIIFASGGPQDAVKWWLNDAVHRNAILNPQMVEVGIGYAYQPGSAYGSYFTVDFAAP